MSAKSVIEFPCDSVVLGLETWTIYQHLTAESLQNTKKQLIFKHKVLT